ncbi:hypothetical protein DCS_04745 [Drechmeria coniospora]|uniref:Uncharacterized protein n=1 Tax=Drechmeria coniospora TaxID=98403 RepID=A0A151GL45_DRECN|nr:hypothetical protein DCS_04745 [Drechmeria coniospora]KYK57732.1 hypothetical protein DCS_04745 [Drechmeria coniospora]ODA79622.1 hypothetical protein RJ55_05216 [Drechmeria coniospora]
MSMDAGPSRQGELELAEPVTPAGSGAGLARKSKEEYLLSRLLDQSFNIKTYPDPLIPRKGVDPQFFPKGVTPERELQWLDRIKAVRAEQADNGTKSHKTEGA